MSDADQILKDVPFFALLDDQERSVLAERVDVIRVAAETVLFTYGEPGDSLYVVKSGKVELFFNNDTGDRIVLETAGPGDFFGELSLTDGGARTATALVKEDTEALVVDRGDLEEFFKLRPAAALDVLAAMGRRMRETARLLRHTASRNVNAADEDHRTAVMKVADWISEFSGSLPFLFIHCVLFFVWVILNVSPLSRSRIGGWDPFPFGLLTMVVSLEAIILSVLCFSARIARSRESACATTSNTR